MMKNILKILACIFACFTLTACAAVKKASKNKANVPVQTIKQADKGTVTFFFMVGVQALMLKSRW